MTNDAHWARHTKAVQRRILERVMFEIRLHTMGGPPIATRIEMLKLRIAELEAEAATGQASATHVGNESAEKQVVLPWTGSCKDDCAKDGAVETGR